MFENVRYNISSAPTRLSSKIRKPSVYSLQTSIYIIVSNLLFKNFPLPRRRQRLILKRRNFNYYIATSETMLIEIEKRR